MARARSSSTGVVKDRLQGQLDLEGLAEARDQPGGQQE